MRDIYLDPINILQVDLLARSRAADIDRRSRPDSNERFCSRSTASPQDCATPADSGADARPGYFFWKFGVRFSAKARGPSFASSDCMTALA